MDDKAREWLQGFEIDKNIDCAAAQRDKIARCYFLLGRYPKDATHEQIEYFKANLDRWKSEDLTDDEKLRYEIDKIGSYYFSIRELPKDYSMNAITGFLEEVIKPKDQVLYERLLNGYLGW